VLGFQVTATSKHRIKVAYPSWLGRMGQNAKEASQWSGDEGLRIPTVPNRSTKDFCMQRSSGATGDVPAKAKQHQSTDLTVERSARWSRP
jgi:hypothetical protein